MSGTFRADGDTWRVTSEGHDPQHAVQTVVFHCVSNSQRPYRVVQVPEALLGNRHVDSLGESELSELFGRTHTMDFSHDAASNPASHGFGDPPLG